MNIVIDRNFTSLFMKKIPSLFVPQKIHVSMAVFMFLFCSAFNKYSEWLINAPPCYIKEHRELLIKTLLPCSFDKRSICQML